MTIIMTGYAHWKDLLPHAALTLGRAKTMTLSNLPHDISPWTAFWKKHSNSPISAIPNQDHLTDIIRKHLPLWNVKRTGWTRTVPAFHPDTETAEQVENVAQHSYKTALLAAALCPEYPVEAFVMGIIHDLAEIQIGDIPPAQVKNKSQKHAEECKAFRTLIGSSPCQPETAQKLISLFDTYTHDDTHLANIVHTADKLDMAFQALHYECLYHLDLQEFLDSAQNIIQNSPAYISVRSTWHC